MKITNLIKTASVAVALLGSAHAASYSFTPSQADLWDLDHNYYYAWGVNFSIPQGQTITGATLSIAQINNWDNNPNILYINLLNSLPALWNINGHPNIKYGYDNEGGGNAFQNSGIALTTFSDTNGTGQTNNFSYNFTSSQLSTLTSYINQGGDFALGFDPDCHFYNNGISFVITTTNTPPPTQGVPDHGSTVAFLGLALLGLAGLKRRMVA